MYSRIGVGAAVLICALVLSSGVAVAQAAPPIQGVSGTIATEGSIDSQKKAAGAVARGAARLLPSGDGSAQNPLDALAEGSRVVVQDAVPASSPSTEGVVIDINRRRQQITVRFADKTTETLHVLDRSGASPAGAHVVVSLADQPGEKVGYHFTRVS